MDSCEKTWNWINWIISEESLVLVNSSNHFDWVLVWSFCVRANNCVIAIVESFGMFCKARMFINLTLPILWLFYSTIMLLLPRRIKSVVNSINQRVCILLFFFYFNKVYCFLPLCIEPFYKHVYTGSFYFPGFCTFLLRLDYRITLLTI